MKIEKNNEKFEIFWFSKKLTLTGTNVNKFLPWNNIWHFNNVSFHFYHFFRLKTLKNRNFCDSEKFESKLVNLHLTKCECQFFGHIIHGNFFKKAKFRKITFSVFEKIIQKIIENYSRNFWEIILIEKIKIKFIMWSRLIFDSSIQWEDNFKTALPDALENSWKHDGSLLLSFYPLRFHEKNEKNYKA